ncbi:MAG: CDP-diacylglycerol--glycerol-3-phosphate 3-phosphatidyltransferase [Thermodesulfobacteriota bacterium]
MANGRLNLPNIITIGRILASPAVFALVLVPSPLPRFAAFVLFLAAAFSDLWDGYLARKHGLITDLGKLLDPLADKLLLVCTFIPFYVLSHGASEVGELPVWGPLPLWAVGVIFGRELAITLFRGWAARQGVVISAGKSGKYKAFSQNLFIGGLLLWYPLQMLALEGGWNGGFWTFWSVLHGWWIAVTLTVAIILTVYSMLDYLWSYRTLVGVRR